MYQGLKLQYSLPIFILTTDSILAFLGRITFAALSNMKITDDIISMLVHFISIIINIFFRLMGEIHSSFKQQNHAQDS